MKRIAAGIVSFNPNITRLKENINSIRPQVESMLIVDNGSDNVEEIESVCRKNDCILIKNGKNKGIAYALNRICGFYYSKEFDWVITLDQDSVSPENLIFELSKNISENVGAAGPKIVYRNNEKYAPENHKNLEAVDWIITSASLTNLAAWKKTGGFDEKLFIDGVDKELYSSQKKRL